MRSIESRVVGERRGVVGRIALVGCLIAILRISWCVEAKNDRPAWQEFSSGSCSARDASRNASASCQGVRIVRRILQQLLENTSKLRDIEILDGVNLVEVGDRDSSFRRAKGLPGGVGGMESILRFFENRELRVKLPRLLPRDIEATFEQGLSSAGQARKGGGGGLGGGGGKKGDGGIMIMAMMMGKMMAALGFGGLGMMAMKALMVSSLALMLSMIVAIKKLTSGGGDDGGSGHHVVYAQEVSSHHHRRKRNAMIDDHRTSDDLLDLPYRGYANFFVEPRSS